MLELLANTGHALQRVRQGHLSIPKDSVVSYETAIKADKFLLLVHGTPDEAARARSCPAPRGQLRSKATVEVKPTDTDARASRRRAGQPARARPGRRTQGTGGFPNDAYHRPRQNVSGFRR